MTDFKEGGVPTPDYDTDDIIVCKRKKVKKPNERQEKPNFIVSFD